MPPTRNWNERYVTGDTPWEVGSPSPELQRVMKEYDIPRGRALEMGCGSGDNAIFLHRQGFQVTAFDLSELAVERARAKAVEAGVAADFLATSFAGLPGFETPFSFIFDRGFYHIVRQQDAAEVVDRVLNLLAPGGLWLSLMGNANEQRENEHGPPQVKAKEICDEWEPGFELVHLREFHFDGNSGGAPFRPLAWSVLGRKRQTG